jgi:hypothetical protein
MVERAAGVTARVTGVLVMVPDTAVIVVVPAAAAVARPVALIVATPVFDDVQFTVAVTFRILLSAKVPVAVNCWAPPAGIEAFGGVTEIDTRAGAGPPPPPQPNSAIQSMNAGRSLLDLIGAHSGGDQ